MSKVNNVSFTATARVRGPFKTIDQLVFAMPSNWRPEITETGENGCHILTTLGDSDIADPANLNPTATFNVRDLLKALQEGRLRPDLTITPATAKKAVRGFFHVG